MASCETNRRAGLKITDVQDEFNYGPHEYSLRNPSKCILCGMAGDGICMANLISQSIIGEGVADCETFDPHKTFLVAHEGKTFVCQATRWTLICESDLSLRPRFTFSFCAVQLADSPPVDLDS